MFNCLNLGDILILIATVGEKRTKKKERRNNWVMQESWSER